MNPSEQDIIGKKLLKYAMQNNWKEVIEIYRKSPEAHKAKITRLGDTALHIAISDGKEWEVEELVSIIKEYESQNLRMKNDLGNTPLHLAAYLGNKNMCYCIASGDPTLIGIRNNDMQTPLFLAVLHGRKQAFLYLNSLGRYGYCRGKDGDTILHSAIDGEYFEIAFHIIHHYEELVNSVNEKGVSPLHILASKPSAFGSGSHNRGFVYQFIYRGIFVDEITLDTTEALAEGLEYDHKTAKYPENYQTCLGFFLFVRNLVRTLMRGNIKKENDEESSKGQHEQEGEKMNNKKGQQEAGITKPVPENWTTCFNFVKVLRKAMFVFLGSLYMENMREEKKKHVWSVQIMRKLIEHASLYEYEFNGKRPDPSAPGFDFMSLDFDRKDVEDRTEVSSQNSNENEKNGEVKEKENKVTPLLTAEDILEQFPVNTEKKSHIKKLLKGRNITTSAVFNNECDTFVWVCARKKGEALEMEKIETPLLIAAKNGILEMVKEILELFPLAINETNADHKNIVLLAVENRQPLIYSCPHVKIPRKS